MVQSYIQMATSRAPRQHHPEVGPPRTASATRPSHDSVVATPKSIVPCLNLVKAATRCSTPLHHGSTPAQIRLTSCQHWPNPLGVAPARSRCRPTVVAHGWLAGRRVARSFGRRWPLEARSRSFRKVGRPIPRTRTAGLGWHGLPSELRLHSSAEDNAQRGRSPPPQRGARSQLGQGWHWPSASAWRAQFSIHDVARRSARKPMALAGFGPGFLAEARAGSAPSLGQLLGREFRTLDPDFGPLVLRPSQAAYGADPPPPV